MIYLFEGLLLMMMASNQSGVQGRHAIELGLPFGWLAATIWILVPVIFVTVSIRKVRERVGLFQHVVQPLAAAAIFLPTFVFSTQTEKIPLRGYPTVEAMREVLSRFDDRVLFSSYSTRTHAYIPKSLDRNEVAFVIYELDPTVDPTSAEQDESLKP